MCKTFASWLNADKNENNKKSSSNRIGNNPNKVPYQFDTSKSTANTAAYAKFTAAKINEFVCKNCQKLNKHQQQRSFHSIRGISKPNNKFSFIAYEADEATQLKNNSCEMISNVYATPFSMKTSTDEAGTTAPSYSNKAHPLQTLTSNSSSKMILNNNKGNNYTHSSSVGIDVATAGNSATYFTPAIAHVLLAPTTTTAAKAAAVGVVTTTTTTSAVSSTASRSASAAVAAVAAATPVAAVTPLVQDLLPSLLTRNGTSYIENAISGGNTGSNNSSGSSNATTKDENAHNLNSFYFYETEQFAVLWILFTVIVLGNSAVLFVMFINKNRKSRMNYFIRQLALADLSVGLLNVLTDIIWRITISWRAGNVACKLIRFSQVCVTYSSTYVLVAMSIDRYDAITHPMNFSKSWKRARHLVVGAWLLSALFSLPILLLYEEKLIQGQTQCWIELGSPFAWQLYMSLVAMTLFAIPALIISACYAIIVKTIWSKGSMFVPAERAGLSIPPARRASSRGIIPRAKVKTVKMTFVIVIVFILCWSPYIVFDLLQVFGQIPQTQTNVAIATFIQSLAPLNSAANPLIYCLFSSQVFRTLSRFRPFKWFTCCCKSYRNNSTQPRCNTVGRRLHNSCDSMRTLTTSLTVSSRRSTKPTARVVICERPKCAAAMSEV